MSHIRTLLILLAGLRLFGAGQSSTESLFRAIQTADNAAVKRLLNAGIDANAKDPDGTPALMAANLFADAHTIQLLVDRGADPNATNEVGAPALMWAVPGLENTKLLAARDADVNARSTNLKRTPLLYATAPVDPDLK